MADLDALLDAWRIPRPRSLRPTAAGANNRTFLVGSRAGRHVLRLSSSGADLGRVRFEHAVLAALQHRGLPFAVPRPLASTAGTTFVLSGTAIAACYAALAGNPPPDGTDGLSACGAALGDLDAALAGIDVGSAPKPAAFGDLSRIHPAAPDPVAALADVPVTPATLARALGLLADLMEGQPGLYSRLPGQTVHADFDPSNVLVADGGVSGVLDFEFAAPAPRAMDLAVGLHGFAGIPRNEADYWARIGAFSAGYRTRISPTPDEVAALPDLVRLREATSLVHWAARWTMGHTDDRNISRRVERLLLLDGALLAHGSEMVRRVVGH